jgi:two-component system, NarL family, sensor histidine kinase ComP
MLRKLLFRSMLTFFIVYQCWAFYLIFQHPVIGVNLKENAAASQWTIGEFDSTSISGEADLRKGDVVIAVNGQPAGDYSAVRQWRTMDQADSITVQRDSHTFTVTLSRLSNPVLYDIFVLLAEFSSLFIALLLFNKTGSSVVSSRYLSLVFFNIAFIFQSLSTSIRGDPTGKFLISTFIILLPAAFYQFLTGFLKETGSIRLPSSFLKWFCGVAGVSSMLQGFYFLDSSSYRVYSRMTDVTLAISVLGIVADFALLAFVYVKQRHIKPQVAIIIKTVFMSLFVSLSPIVFLSFLPKLIFGHEWQDSLSMSWFIFIFPLTFVYLLTTRRLYDIDMIMRRILFAIAIAALPSLLFTGAVDMLFPQQASAERLVLVFILLLTGLTFILYSLENIHTKWEPALFPRKYRLQTALKKISKDLESISSFGEMKDIVLVDIVETLEVEGGAIVFRYKDSMEIIVEGELGQLEVEQLLEAGVWDSLSYTCFEISRQEEYTSYLVMTRKKSQTVLGAEEIQWLNLIITYLAVSLENMQLIRKLNRKLQQLSSLLPEEEEAENLIWFRKLMFELQEKERIRIATDLHDTTMQDLFFLKGRLESIQDKYKHTREDAELLGSLMDYIDIINMNLRQSCFELHPYLLKEIGLVGTLNKLISTERSISSFQISFVTSEVSEIEGQDMETKRHLFRLVQELLNNAKKHSHASLIRISLYVHRGMVYLEYMDDGVGFELNRSVVREIGSSGIGMEQMKSRILSLGGRYELQTATGKGLVFAAHFPVREGRTA